MTTPLLDFAALTAPLPGEQPAGVRLPADIKKKMEDARKEFEPHPDDPSQPPIAKKPDWAGIIKLATDSLTKNSKDLLTVVRLTEAVAKRDGFTGLRAGLGLLNLFVADCWDRMHPVIETPDDIDSRAGPIQWLADSESGAWFPSSVGKFPLVRVSGEIASHSDCQRGKLGDKPLTSDLLKTGEPATPTTAEDISECLKELETLDQVLVERMSDQAPTLAGLRDVLTQCQNFLKHMERGAPEANQETVAESHHGAMATPGQSSSGGQSNRADSYRQLARLADDLARMEPHSPIPDLLRWAVKLGGMPFRDLIKELVSEPSVLADIRKQLGIKDAEGTG